MPTNEWTDGNNKKPLIFFFERCVFLMFWLLCKAEFTSLKIHKTTTTKTSNNTHCSRRTLRRREHTHACTHTRKRFKPEFNIKKTHNTAIIIIITIAVDAAVAAVVINISKAWGFVRRRSREQIKKNVDRNCVGFFFSTVRRRLSFSHHHAYDRMSVCPPSISFHVYIEHDEKRPRRFVGVCLYVAM